MTGCARLAVLIDSDNTRASLTKELLEEIAKYVPQRREVALHRRRALADRLGAAAALRHRVAL